MEEKGKNRGKAKRKRTDDVSGECVQGSLHISWCVSNIFGRRV